MAYNKIYSIEEYMNQGFTENEAYAVRIADRLHNRYVDRGYLTEREWEKYEAIVKRTGM